MVALTSLWLPILLSAVFVWMASAIIWAVLRYHDSDYKKLPDEDAVRSALRMQNVTPGEYLVPAAHGKEAMKDPDTIRKYEEGPVGFFRILPPGKPALGKPMALSFAFYVAVGIVVAYIAGRALTPGTEYLQVFRIAGTAAWLAYAGALIPDAIWFGRPWRSAWKGVGDALIYALLTAGTFGWLWPHG